MYTFSTKEFRQYFDLYKTLDQNAPAVLVSVNITKGEVVNRKLYFEIKNNVGGDVAKKFLTTDSEYNKYIPYWCSTRESSLCFGIKDSGNITKYLHIKFEENKVTDIDQDLTKPKHLHIPFLSNKTGISFEYSGNAIVKKNYFYFHTPVERGIISKKFNLDENVDHFEYTEMGNEYKIISVYDDYLTPDVAVESRLRALKYKAVDNVIDFFKTHYGIQPSLFGVYKEGTISIYWSFTNKESLLEKLLNG